MLAAGSHSGSVEKREIHSPYRKLEQSPTKKQQRPTLTIADQLQRDHANRVIQNQDFNKRLEEIKRKYTSPIKHPRILSTPATPVDQNPVSKRSIINQNNFKFNQDFTSLKNVNKTISDLPRPTQKHQSRQPLQSLIRSLQPSNNLSPCKDAVAKIPEDQRINSIDIINDKIKNILHGINYQNDRFSEKTRMSETFDHKGLKAILSARPEESKERKHLYTHTSLQKEQKSTQLTNKSSINASFNKQKRYVSKDFDSKMLDIKQRIKKSEENRLRAMESLQKTQPSPIVPSTHVQVERKQQIVEKHEQLKERLNTGPYSHRYLDFGKNKSRNILQQLKSFGKQPSSQTNRNLTEESAPTQTKIETKKLINLLVEQVNLDEEFRNAKIWLQINNDEGKWSKLRQHISRKEFRICTQEQIKAIFKCSQQDHNPFFINQPNQCLQNIVSKYFNTQKHWKTRILKQLDMTVLSKEGFKAEVLDLELKGYLQIEDIVRYLNIETGKFYRNRDLSLIFKRISKTSRLSFEEFVKIIAK